MSAEPLRGPRRLVLLAALTLPLGACDWFTDFKRQPKIDPWEAYTYDSLPRFRGQPQMSVPITGSAVPGFVVSYAALPATIDSMSPLPNPVPISEGSLLNGRKLYQINCAVCHGDNGNGQGSATRYGMVPISLLTPVTQGRTDGYIYGMIRNGRGIMPPYNRIEDRERWDVVNYVRALQGRAGVPAQLGPVGRPGQTGATLPGASPLGPTRPAPYRPSQAVPAAGDTAGAGAATRPDSGALQRPAPTSGTRATPGARPDTSRGARADTSRDGRNPGAQP